VAGGSGVGAWSEGLSCAGPCRIVSKRPLDYHICAVPVCTFLDGFSKLEAYQVPTKKLPSSGLTKRRNSRVLDADSLWDLDGKHVGKVGSSSSKGPIMLCPAPVPLGSGPDSNSPVSTPPSQQVPPIRFRCLNSESGTAPQQRIASLPYPLFLRFVRPGLRASFPPTAFQ
jgi:hypothetical protein